MLCYVGMVNTFQTYVKVTIIIMYYNNKIINIIKLNKSSIKKVNIFVIDNFWYGFKIR